MKTHSRGGHELMTSPLYQVSMHAMTLESNKITILWLDGECMIRIRYENILMYFWPFFLTCMFVIELWKEGRVTCFSKKSKHKGEKQEEKFL